MAEQLVSKYGVGQVVKVPAKIAVGKQAIIRGVENGRDANSSTSKKRSPTWLYCLEFPDSKGVFRGTEQGFLATEEEITEWQNG